MELNSSINLSRGGLLLYALLVGGDYHTGVAGCGQKAATGLERCGFGDELLNAVENQILHTFLSDFSDRIRFELRNNPRGILKTKYTSLARTFPDCFPEQYILGLYITPTTSWSDRHTKPQHLEWTY